MGSGSSSLQAATLRGVSVYSERVGALADAVRKSSHSESVSDGALATLDVMDNLSEEKLLESRSGWTSAVEGSLSQLSIAIRDGDDALLNWTFAASSAMREAVRGAIDGGATALRPALDYVSAHFQRMASVRDLHRITRKAEEALDDTIEARDTAKDAAGEAGNASLAHYFQIYADAEGRRANGFRWASIVSIAGAILLAVFFPHSSEELPLVPAGELAGVIYRLAILAGVGGLAAYFGRLSGHHRRTHNWAKSIEVQLNSFPAFMKAVPDDDRGDVFRAFARRVLGQPPEKGVETPDESLPVNQLVDLVAALAKRQP